MKLYLLSLLLSFCCFLFLTEKIAVASATANYSHKQFEFLLDYIATSEHTKITFLAVALRADIFSTLLINSLAQGGGKIIHESIKNYLALSIFAKAQKIETPKSQVEQFALFHSGLEERKSSFDFAKLQASLACSDFTSKFIKTKLSDNIYIMREIWKQLIGFY
jgi:hypothetical protein